MTDYLSRLNFNTITEPPPLYESFPNGQLLSAEVVPWYAYIVNYLITSQLLQK